jgi:hypothetical protein
MVSFVCGKKICRVHKNQAVNLLQITIHGPDSICFVDANGVKIQQVRFPGGFQGIYGFKRTKDIIKGIAPKFLHKPAFLLL